MAMLQNTFLSLVENRRSRMVDTPLVRIGVYLSAAFVYALVGVHCLGSFCSFTSLLQLGGAIRTSSSSTREHVKSLTTKEACPCGRALLIVHMYRRARPYGRLVHH